MVNPAVLGGVVATMLATTIVACLVPAMKALRIDPLVAFKAE